MNKKAIIISFLVIFAYISGCCPTKETIINEVRNIPSNQIVTKYDTLYIKESQKDTVLCIDSIEVEKPIYFYKDKLRVEVTRIGGDTIRINGKCIPDTIYTASEIITVMPEVDTKKTAMDWVIYVFASLGLFVLLLFVYKITIGK